MFEERSPSIAADLAGNAENSNMFSCHTAAKASQIDWREGSPYHEFSTIQVIGIVDGATVLVIDLETAGLTSCKRS